MKFSVGYIPEVSNSVFPHAVTSVADTLLAYLNPKRRPCLRVRALTRPNQSASLIVYIDYNLVEVEDKDWELDIPNVYMRYRVDVEVIGLREKKTAFQHPIIDIEPVRYIYD